MGNPFRSEKVKFLVLTPMWDLNINLKNFLNKMMHLDFMHALYSVVGSNLWLMKKEYYYYTVRKPIFSAEAFHRKTL